MVSSSALPWYWVVETLADLKQVDPSILQAIISSLPNFYSDAPVKVREKVALRYLEKCVGRSRREASNLPSGSRSLIDVSRSSEDVLCCYLRKVTGKHKPERNSRQRFRHYIRQFILHKRATMPKSSLDLLKESILEGSSTILSSLKEHSGLTKHDQEDLPQCNANGEHEAVKKIINQDSNDNCSGGQIPATVAPTNSDMNLHASPNDPGEKVNPSSGEKDYFQGDMSVQPEPPIDEDSDNDPYDFESADMVATEKHRMLNSLVQTNHDSAYGNCTEQSFCLKCCKAGELLTCRANGCLVAVHKSCLDPPVRFDKTGLFYCPFCSYARAAVAYSKARKILSAFVGKDIIESHRKKKSPGRHQESFEKDVGHHLDDHSGRHQSNRLDGSYTEAEGHRQMETAGNKDEQPAGSLEKDIGGYDASVNLEKLCDERMDDEGQSIVQSSTQNLLAENQRPQQAEPHSEANIGNLPLKDVDKSQPSYEAFRVQQNDEKSLGDDHIINKQLRSSDQVEITLEIDTGNKRSPSRNRIQLRSSLQVRNAPGDEVGGYDSSINIQKLDDKRMDAGGTSTVQNSTQNLLAENQQPQHAEPHSAANIGDLSLKDVDKSQASYEAFRVQQIDEKSLDDDHINNQQLRSSDQVETAPDNATGNKTSLSRNRIQLRSSPQVQTAAGDDIGNKTLPSRNSERHLKRRSRETDTVETHHPQEMVENQKRYKSSPRKNRKRVSRPERYSNPVIPSGRRTKLPWTSEEEEALREGMQKFALKNGLVPWKEILESGGNVFHRTRLPGDLKDKWRNIMIKEGIKH
ncbi:uncharacterized protein [Typha latifolia]|uniref:uncharacterized protein n=1 Tax=Typha latifolia TaxID=4733 RepID=UPI003C30AB83